MAFLINQNRQFFHLSHFNCDAHVPEFDQQSFNALANAKDVKLAFSYLKPSLVRDINGIVVAPNANYKFKLNLQGAGTVFLPENMADLKFRFLSSFLLMHAGGNKLLREPLFGVVFEKYQPDLIQISGPKDGGMGFDGSLANCFYSPIIFCKVSSFEAENNSWKLCLEEI